MAALYLFHSFIFYQLGYYYRLALQRLSCSKRACQHMKQWHFLVKQCSSSGWIRFLWLRRTIAVQFSDLEMEGIFYIRTAVNSTVESKYVVIGFSVLLGMEQLSCKSSSLLSVLFQMLGTIYVGLKYVMEINLYWNNLKH